MRDDAVHGDPIDQLLSRDPGFRRQAVDLAVRRGWATCTEDAEDLVSDTLVRFRVTPFAREAPAVAFKSALRYAGIDRVRRRERCARLHADLVRKVLAASKRPAGPDSELEPFEITDLLSPLARRQRALVRLCWIGGYSVSAVAAALEVSRQTAHLDLARARSALKATLGG